MSCQLPYIRKTNFSNTEKVRLEAIHLDILTEAKNSKAFRKEDGRFVTLKNNYPAATQFVKNVNDRYQQIVATLPEVGRGKHSLNVNVLPLSQEEQGTLFQMASEKTIPVSSPKLVELSKEFLNKIGVKYESVDYITVNGKKINANAAAYLTQSLIQVVEGKEAQALPEEAMHFALAIIKQKNKPLYLKLLSEINKFNKLKEVFAEYGNNPLYQTKEGKPDVLKLKEEAIGKVLAEVLGAKVASTIENSENVSIIQRLWKSIVDFLKDLFGRSGFDQAAMDVLSGKIEGSVEDVRENQEDVFLQSTEDKQSSVYNKIKDIQSKVIKKDDGYYVNGAKVPRRVTDLVKDWYENRFKNNELTKSEYDKAVDDLKAEKGTKGHLDLEHAFEVFVDKDGFLRETELDDSEYVSQIDPENREIYELLKENLRERLNSFPQGTRFMSEAIVYDEKRNLAGTVDFLAIDPNGNVNILDWKFMDLNVDKYKDVPWYKVNAWRQQMDQYKLILEKVYGVQRGDFQQTRMIPIKVHYSKGDRKQNILPQLLKIEIGAVDPKQIKDDYLIPVGTETEKTGNKKIDKLIEKLNALYTKFSEKKVPVSERLSKAEQLNALFSAIRQLQMKQNIAPLLDQANILNRQIEATISKFNKQWSGKNPSDFTQKQISDFYEEIETAQHAIEQYSNLDIELRFLTDDSTEEGKQLKDHLKKTVEEARSLMSELSEVSGEFVSEFVAGSEKVENILAPERIIKGLSRWFSSTSTLQLKALNVLYKKANRAFTYAAMDTVEESKKLQKLKEDYDKWAQSKGLDKSNYFDLIMDKGKNQLIKQYRMEFFSTLKENIKDKDFKWIKENIEVAEYNVYLKEKLQKEIDRIIEKPRILTQEEQAAIDKYKESKEEKDLPFSIKSQIDNLRSLYNTSTTESPGWFLYDDIKKFPKKQWETKEWKTLHEKGNEPALAFYQYIQDKNKEYSEIGYLHDKQAKSFLPFVRKGVIEKLIFGGNIALGEQFLRSISIDEGDIGYGKIDPLTGRPIDTVPIYFTKEIEGELSTDLFRNMALYNEMALRYKYVQEIEAQARALVNTERSKKAIATSYFGKTVYKDGIVQYTPDNNENAKLVEDMVKSIIYGQRYIQSETFDQILGTIGGFGKKANEKLGMKIFPEDLEGRQVSVNKVITQLNNTFQLNALGLNPLSAISNLFGGSFQSTINAGTYFTKTEFMATEAWLLMNKMTGKDQKKMIAALEYFLPLTDNYNKEIAKTLSLSSLSQENIQEFLMVLMRKSDFFVQTANFYAFLNNSIVLDGKIINAREYLKSQPEYQNLYKLSYEERKTREAKFEEDVKNLVAENGVMNLAKIENDTLVIPGVERKDESVVELRRKVQKLSKDALGNLSEDDLRLINMNIIGKSFMVFKNWIPRPIDVRLGGFKYNSSSDAYEWGRMRMVFRIISDDLLHSLGNLTNAMQGNEEGVKYMRELWEKKRAEYKESTEQELQMTEDQFMDLVRYNIKAQLVDALFMLTLFSFFLGLKALAPDDDEDPKVKNLYKFVLRASDKIKDELWFFYDPTNLSQLVSSGIFPSLSYINNLKKVVSHFRREVFGIVAGDEEAQKKAYPIKYLMKSFPVSNQATQILPIFYPDLAKDLGIKPTTQARPIGF